MSEVVGTAFVEIVPVTAGFGAALSKQITPQALAANSAVKGLAASTEQAAVAGRSAAQAQAAYTKSVAAGGGAAAAATAETKALAAAQAQQAAAARQSSAATVGLRAAAGGGVIGQAAGMNALAAGAVALGVAFTSVVKQTASFETQLNTFKVVAQATESQMRDVSEAAKQLGSDVTLPAVSAADAAEAMTELAKAGLTVKDTLAAARGVLQLATAAQISNADAAKVAGSALNAFGLEGAEAVRIADLLAGASIAAQGEITDMAASLTQASAVARQAGLSIEDTTTFIALLAKNGVLGSDAGTSLRTSILRLIAPLGQARERIEDLGLQVRDASGDLRPEVFDELGAALKRLAPADAQQALLRIFGQDAIRAASIFAREGTDGFNAMAEAVTRQGAASDVASAKTKGIAGSFAALKSNVETAALSLGALLTPALKDFLDVAAAGVATVNTLSREIENLSSQKLPGGGSVGDLFKGAKDSFLKSLPNVGPIIELRRLIKDQLGRDKVTGRAAAPSPDTLSSADEVESGGTFAGDRSLIPRRRRSTLSAERAFQIRELQAQLTESTDDDLKLAEIRKVAIQKQIDSLEGGVIRGKNDQKRLRNLYEEIVSADQQINTIQQTAQQARDDALKERQRQAKEDRDAARQKVRDDLGIARDQIQLASLTATTEGQVKAARKREIEFLRERVNDTRLDARERLDAQIELAGLQKEEREAAKQDRIDKRDRKFSLKEQRLQLQLQRSQLTETTADDKKAQRALIRFYGESAKQARKTGQQAKALDLESRKVSQQIALRGTESNAGGQTDFFQEAARQFRQFGSNIGRAGDPLSGQDARGQFAGLALDRGRNTGNLQRDQLSEAESQTDLLRQIRDRLRVDTRAAEGNQPPNRRPPNATDIARVNARNNLAGR